MGPAVLDLAARIAPDARLVRAARCDVDEAAFLDDWSGDPRQVRRVFEKAEPLPFEAKTPDECTITVEALERGWVIVTQLADPQWSARVDQTWDSTGPLTTSSGRRFAGQTSRAGGSVLKFRHPAAGRLRSDYEARDVELGLGFSVIAWAGWLIAVIRTIALSGRKRSIPAVSEGEGTT